jgi:hypothetical protein
MPNFVASGDSFAGDLSAEAGFQGIQPVINLLRTIDRVSRTWYAELKTARQRSSNATASIATASALRS